MLNMMVIKIDAACGFAFVDTLIKSAVIHFLPYFIEALLLLISRLRFSMNAYRDCCLNACHQSICTCRQSTTMSCIT